MLKVIVNYETIDIIAVDTKSGATITHEIESGGIALCRALVEHLQNAHQLNIGMEPAERAVTLASAALHIDYGEDTITISGRHADTAQPQYIDLPAARIYEIIDDAFDTLVMYICTTISDQITDKATNVMLSGFYANLYGLDTRLQSALRADALPEAIVTIS